MNIGSAASAAFALNAAHTSIEVVSKAQDLQKLEGEAAVRLIEAAGVPGGAGEQHRVVIPADGTGHHVDVVA